MGDLLTERQLFLHCWYGEQSVLRVNFIIKNIYLTKYGFVADFKLAKSECFGSGTYCHIEKISK